MIWFFIDFDMINGQYDFFNRLEVTIDHSPFMHLRTRTLRLQPPPGNYRPAKDPENTTDEERMERQKWRVWQNESGRSKRMMVNTCLKKCLKADMSQVVHGQKSEICTVYM